jgi:hypothetical protein
MDRREHHRVQLRLPARLRWTTPFGQKTEVCTTVDVSRGGMLVPCREPHAEGMPLWVTFPFDPSLTVGQPEIFARVVRAAVVIRDEVAKRRNGNGNGNGHSNSHHKNGNGCGNGNGHAHHHAPSASVFRSPSATEAAAVERVQGISDAHEVSAPSATAARNAEASFATEFSTLLALRFEVVPRRQALSTHALVPLRDVERRATPRRPFVVPVRVRTEHVPWFEETMTVDSSADGLRFRSNREYARGEFLVVSFESAATSPWLGVTESLLRVVRVESEPDVAELQVAVCRTQQFAFRF